MKPEAKFRADEQKPHIRRDRADKAAIQVKVLYYPAIVPEKPVKADGGKDLAVAGDTARKGIWSEESSCSKEDDCQRIGE